MELVASSMSSDTFLYLNIQLVQLQYYAAGSSLVAIFRFGQCAVQYAIIERRCTVCSSIVVCNLQQGVWSRRGSLEVLQQGICSYGSIMHFTASRTCCMEVQFYAADRNQYTAYVSVVVAACIKCSSNQCEAGKSVCSLEQEV